MIRVSLRLLVGCVGEGKGVDKFDIKKVVKVRDSERSRDVGMG